jgi:trehalose-phosphatase
MSRPRHLLRAWAEVERRMLRANNLALFADFDGTLTPIRRSPDEVRLSAKVRSLLQSIAACAQVGIISGRPLADLEARVALRGIWYAGEHGHVLHAPGKAPVLLLSATQRVLLRKIRLRIRRSLAGVEGLLLEQKRASIAVHYRNAAPSSAARAIATAEEIARRHPSLRLLHGKKVVEVLPPGNVTKWTAIRSILRSTTGKSPFVTYLGDDVTDERVFERLAGISVVVGEKKQTAAPYYLSSLAEVREFLKRFAALVASTQPTSTRP